MIKESWPSVTKWRCRDPMELSSLIFSILLVSIAPASDQCRQLMPNSIRNSIRNVATSWQFPGMTAQLHCAARGINIGLFPGILEVVRIQSLPTFPRLRSPFSVIPARVHCRSGRAGNPRPAGHLPGWYTVSVVWPSAGYSDHQAAGVHAGDADRGIGRPF
jgi:hypothetical protein